MLEVDPGDRMDWDEFFNWSGFEYSTDDFWLDQSEDSEASSCSISHQDTDNDCDTFLVSEEEQDIQLAPEDYFLLPPAENPTLQNSSKTEDS